MASDDFEPLLHPDIHQETETPQNHYLNKVQNKKLFLATFAAVLGPLSFGFVLGYSSPAISYLKNADNPNLILDKNAASWFGVRY
ncbi:hypothetical protein FKM82_021191 [Ascaphus truei]